MQQFNAEKHPLVSVIVPVYNVEDYLEECIDSIMNQVYKNIEIILIDDGSTDRSGSLCDGLMELDNRIRVIHKKNGGLSSARNAGLEVANGKYILFVDSDDLISELMISAMTEAAEKNNCNLVVSPITQCKSEIHHCSIIHMEMLNSKSVLRSFLEEKSITTSSSGKLYNSLLWEDVRFPEGVIFEDFATIYKVVLKCERICKIDSHFYYYRPNPKGITGSPFTKSKMDYYKVTEWVREELDKKGYNDLVHILKNRTVRYSISFYRDIARSDYKELEDCTTVINHIRKDIARYMFSNYKLTSKMYGLMISCSPTIARHIFSMPK